MSNLDIWDKYADIDPAFTKQITGKDYRGTSPNPQYVIRCLTDMFGPVGVGFGWRVLVEGFQTFGSHDVVHWCRIEFWHTSRENTFEAYGQTKAAYMTRGQNSYLKVDEDAPKKSLTDAITKAASQLGIAANIFLGRWDDSKYVSDVADSFKAKAIDADRLVTEINNIANLDDLKGLWGTFTKEEQAQEAIFAAKETKKAELMAAQVHT